MAKLIVTRLLALVPILLGVSFVAFLLVKLIPGDPIQAMLGLEASPDALRTLRHQYGFDRPLYEQFTLWLWRVLHGDLGHSVQTHLPVARMIQEAVGPTAQLSVAGLLLSLIIAIPAGVLSATRKNSLVDLVASFSALGGLSLPSFWLGILLILFFGVSLQLLPSSGAVSVFADPLQALRHLVLPTVTLGTALAAATMRMTRAAVLETLQQDYMRTATAKGLPARTVIYKHGLRNALLPVITLVGIQMGQLLGGVVVTETVFALPGLGKLTVDAIFARDYPIMQGTVLLMGALFVVINLVTDLLYCVLDPRIRY
jgi:peptide/nickel transport system permease protein